jgi:hypothetical protein
MAAGDKIVVTKTTISAYNTNTSTAAAFTANAATADTDALKQPYSIVPTKAEKDGILLIRSTGAAADGNLTYSIAVGVGGMAAGAATTGTVVKNTTAAIKLDGRYKNASGAFEIEITPAGTDKCLTDHALSVAFIESV